MENPAVTPSPNMGSVLPPPAGDGSAKAQHGPLSRAERERRFLKAVVENGDWFDAHWKSLLQEHPDWCDQFVVVCSRTPSKVLAVSEYHSLAIEKALESPELIEEAAREGVPPGCLITPMTMSVRCLWGDE